MLATSAGLRFVGIIPPGNRYFARDLLNMRLHVAQLRHVENVEEPLFRRDRNRLGAIEQRRVGLIPQPDIRLLLEGCRVRLA